MVPPSLGSYGPEANELAISAGMTPDYWQQEAVNDCLAYGPGGKWVSFEFGLWLSRQNGKGEIITIRKLAGIYILKEKLVSYSAHKYDTAQEHFRKVMNVIDGSAELSREVKKVTRSTAREEIEFYGTGGNRLTETRRIKYLARTKSAGRGFTGETNIWDESQELTDGEVAAQLPTLSAMSMAGNPQVCLFGTPPDVDSDIGEYWIPFRERGLAGELTWWEYSPPEHYDADDPEIWQMCNPALGIRISPAFVKMEYAAMGHGGPQFRRERLGDYPRLVLDLWRVISEDHWRAQARPAWRRPDTLLPGYALALDVDPERRWASIAAAGRAKDGGRVVDLIDHRPGVAWLADRIVELRDAHNPCAIVGDRAGPAANVIDDLIERGVTVETTTAQDMASACGEFYDGVAGENVEARDIFHLDQDDLNAAVAAVTKRNMGSGGAWALNRVSPSAVICPMVASVLAVYGHAKFGGRGGMPWAAFG